MKTLFLFTSSAFAPTAGELDEGHEDYINPGLYGLELGNYLETELEKRGCQVRFRCQEDWGHWIELEHEGKFSLAVGCGNTEEIISGEPEHRVFLHPNKPTVRRFLRKISVEAELEKLAATVRDVLDSNPAISNLRVEDDL